MARVEAKVLEKEGILNSSIVKMLGVLSFIALTTAGAYIRIPLPFTPVPITLQTFFVILAGAMLGKKLGAVSQFGYLVVGIFGLPVFTGGLYGFARLFGPTGGYLLGFILAGYVVGWLLSDTEQAGFVEIVVAMFIGLVTLFLTGTLWLAFVMHTSLYSAFALGVLPFIPGDIIKLLAAATIYQRLQKQSKTAFSE